MKVIELQPSEWSYLERVSQQSTVFHTNEWLTILERTYGGKVHRLGFFDGSQLIGGIPVLVRRKFIYRLAGSPATGTVTAYQGFMYSKSSDYKRLVDCFWNYALASKWDFVEMTCSPEASTHLPTLLPRDIRQEVRQTVALDLRLGEVELFRGMDSSCRNQIRQAQTRGAIVEELSADDSHWIEAYYALSVETYRRQRRPPAIPKDLFENLRAVFGTSATMKVLSVRYKSELVAAAIFLIHKKVLYNLDAVSDRTYAHLRAHNLIQWFIIRWACAQSLETYDMLGANVPAIAHFKKGFGGLLVPYQTCLRSDGWFARLGEQGYRFLAPAARWSLSFFPNSRKC